MQIKAEQFADIIKSAYVEGHSAGMEYQKSLSVTQPPEALNKVDNRLPATEAVRRVPRASSASPQAPVDDGF
jgi:hypothetical protein